MKCRIMVRAQVTGEGHNANIEKGEEDSLTLILQANRYSVRKNLGISW